MLLSISICIVSSKPKNFRYEPFSFEKMLINRITPNAKEAKHRRTIIRYGTLNL